MLDMLETLEIEELPPSAIGFKKGIVISIGGMATGLGSLIIFFP